MGLLSPAPSAKHMHLLCHQLARSAEGGLTLVRSLELFAAGGHARPSRRLAGRLADSLQRGATFAQAALWEGRRLPDLFTSMATIGEQTGSLFAVFQYLAAYYQEILRLKRAFIRQITYPLLVILTAILVIPLARTLVLTSDSDDLPRAVFMVLWRALSPFLFIYLAVGVVNHLLPLRRWIFAFLLRIWPVSRLLRRLALARFAWAMQVLSSAGLSLAPSVCFAARTTGFNAMDRDFTQAALRLKEGSTLTEAFAPARYLSNSHRAYIEVGEASGRLDEAFARIARDQWDEARQAILICIIALGPLLIVLLGVLIIFGLGV